MNDLLEPPAERDMPPGRAARMGADLAATIRRTDRRSPDLRSPDRRSPDRRRTLHRRVAVLAAVVVTAAAGVMSSLVLRPDGGTNETLAMSEAELSPALRAATKQCLTWRETTFADVDVPAPVGMADLTAAASRGDHAIVLFVVPAGYLLCEVTALAGAEVSGGVDGNRWISRAWMPGPIERLGLFSTGPDGGTVMVLGRVSDRVHRLVLEHGDGDTTVARIAGGTFGVISNAEVDITKARLVAYDAQNRVIRRLPMLRPPGATVTSPTDKRVGECYVDPKGTVVYGDPGPRCRPAEPWSH